MTLSLSQVATQVILSTGDLAALPTLFRQERLIGDSAPAMATASAFASTMNIRLQLCMLYRISPRPSPPSPPPPPRPNHSTP